MKTRVKTRRARQQRELLKRLAIGVFLVVFVVSVVGVALVATVGR